MDVTKTILWVEDFDERDTVAPEDDLDAMEEPAAGAAAADKLRRAFPPAHRDRVALETQADGAVAAMDENFGTYDCVVLDVNLSNGWPAAEEAQRDIRERLSHAGVCLPDEPERCRRNAGYYLYLYLLCRGFPKDRVIMRTAYSGKNNLTGNWEAVFRQAGLRAPVSVGKADGDGAFHDALQTLYTGGNRYYLIRRLVLDGLEHWRADLERGDRSPEGRLFNAVVTAENKRLGLHAMTGLLEEVEALLPVRPDGESGKACARVLQRLSLPFETYFDFARAEKNPDAAACLTIMRLMRNWYAHGRFARAEPTEKEFLFLFMVALRALFDDGQRPSGRLGYEEDILTFLLDGRSLPHRLDESEERAAKERVYGFFRSTYHAISEPKNKSFSADYWRMVEALGFEKGAAASCSYAKLIEIIWADKFPVALRPIERIRLNTSGNASIYFNFSAGSTLEPEDFLSGIVLADIRLRAGEQDGGPV